MDFAATPKAVLYPGYPPASGEGSEAMSEVVVPTPAQLRAARELLGMSRAAVGKKFDRGVGIIGEVERGRAGETTVARLVALYEACGVEFHPDGAVRMRQGREDR